MKRSDINKYSKHKAKKKKEKRKQKKKRERERRKKRKVSPPFLLPFLPFSSFVYSTPFDLFCILAPLTPLCQSKRPVLALFLDRRHIFALFRKKLIYL